MLFRALFISLNRVDEYYSRWEYLKIGMKAFLSELSASNSLYYEIELRVIFVEVIFNTYAGFQLEIELSNLINR